MGVAMTGFRGRDMIVLSSQRPSILQAAPDSHEDARMDTSGPLVETVPISQLFCSPINPRRNEAAIPHVVASLRRFGWQQPIVARRSGEVVAGNTRLKAPKRSA